MGRNVEEIARRLARAGWHRFGFASWRPVLAGGRLFRAFWRAIERVLYTVDEWLRFRSGEGRCRSWLKAVLGMVWFFVTYVIRFCVNLLIEPQINPIKHFPVVTVSHKLLLPLIPSFAGVLVSCRGTRPGADRWPRRSSRAFRACSASWCGS